MKGQIHITYSPETFRALATMHFGNDGPGKRLFFMNNDATKAELILKRVGNTNQVATALWLTLLAVFMQSHECTFEQAIEHAKKLAKWSKVGTHAKEIAALRLPH